jgi:hypothetical protein
MAKLDPAIDKRDFDANRPLLGGHAHGPLAHDSSDPSRPTSRHSAIAYSDADDGLLTDVVEEIVERDRRKLAKEVVRICSFVWGVITW